MCSFFLFCLLFHVINLDINKFNYTTNMNSFKIISVNIANGNISKTITFS